MSIECAQIIERLEKIIENWFDKKELAACLFDSEHGLCLNTTYYQKEDGLYSSRESVLYDAIRAWTYFPEKDEEGTGDIFFPVGGSVEYCRDFEHLYNNPKRLHLAVHLLQYLKTNGI